MDSYADLLNLNFMYSLRTGNLLTDMMIAALLPLISGAVAYVTRTWWPQLINQVLAYFSNVDSTSVFFRVAEESGSLYYGHTLRVALSTYVTKVLQPRYDVAELKYITVPGKKLHEAENYAEGLRDYCFVDAGPAKEVPMSLTANLELQQSSAGSGGEEGSGDGGDSGKDKKSADTIFTLVQFRPSFPALRRLLGVEDKEKTAMGQEEGESAADPAAAQAVAELVKAEQGNGDAIQLLLDRALAHYRNEYKEASISSDRFLYQPLLAKAPLTFGVAADDEDRREGAMDCNRYLLRSEKTFSSLFFPDKARLLQLIDNFENKTGKYAIPGYPQKLVLLLYGPPGTGKTSLAKAVAAYTKRDLFAISLSRIRSNEELLKYMFSGQVCIKNNKKKEESHSWRDRDSDDAPSQLDPTRLVYILEDVDATNAVVLKNEAEAEAEEEAGKKSNDKKKKKRVSSKKAAKVVSNGDEEGEEAESEQQPHDDDKTDVDACGNAEKAETENAASEAADAEAESQGTDCEVVAVGGNSGKAKRKLTIEGLTNALNGVLDFPQRIVIMTTNHIERLHPSLLRPGVVTMKLHMHNFDAECAADMVRHYFSHTDIHPAQLQELRGLVEKASTRASKVDAAGHNSDDGSSSAAAECKGFSPAELEQRCAECETVDELLAALRQGSRVNTF